MKGTPVRPGGPLTSKPTWWNPPGYSTTSAFFLHVAPDRWLLDAGTDSAVRFTCNPSALSPPLTHHPKEQPHVRCRVRREISDPSGRVEACQSGSRVARLRRHGD